MTQPLKVLLVEDNPHDAELVLRSLRRAGFEPDWQRVETESDYLRCLDKGLDLVLSDFAMPDFNGLQALDLLKRSGLDIPFILVSATIGEETAVASIKQGATDYLLKDRLARLGPAVTHALEQTQLRRERKAAEEERRLFHTLVDHANDAIEVIDPDTGRFLNVNEKGLVDLGYTRAEFLALRVLDIDPTMDAGAWSKFLLGLRATGVQRGEGRHHRKDGSSFPIEFNAKLVRLDREYLVTAIRDITERKQAEIALRQSREEFKDLFDNAPIGYHEIDAQGRIVRINQTELKMLGYSSEELIGEFVWKMVADSDASHERTLKKLAGSPPAKEFEVLFRRKNGTVFPVLSEDRVMRNAGGSIVGIRSVIRDNTERRVAEEALRESEQRYRHLFESNPHPMWVYEVATWRFLMVNRAAVSQYGYTHEEFLGMTIKDIRPREELPALEENLRWSAPQLEHSGVWRHRFKDGKIAHMEITSHDVVFAGRNGRLVLAYDVSERKRAEEELRDGEAKFRLLAQNINEVFWMTDQATKAMLYVSPAYKTIWGRTCESLYAEPREWLETIHPDDRERVLEAGKVALPEGKYDDAFRIVRPEGAIRWIRARAFPVRNDQGDVYRVVGTAEDITEQKLLEEKFLRTQRMEAIGTLASGIAHDLNNILAPILMSASLLQDKLSDRQDRELLAMVERSAKRGAGIIGQLLTFSRGIEGARVSVQPRHLVKEMVQIMQETFPRNIRITQDLPNDLWHVVADATQIHQVLLNLCVNARDAMPDGGCLSLSARNVRLNGTELQSQLPAKPGLYVVLIVADTGMGIKGENVHRIFDPFFTTKETGKGTGLGLSTVMGIVKSHDGFVGVESEVGQGTVFKVYLPASAGESIAADSDHASGPKREGRGEMILLVDDEAPIREAMRVILEKHGYRVVTAADGEAGIALFIQHQASVRLVITDLMMPGIGGHALIRALKGLIPALRVVICSGMDQHEKQAELELLGVTEVLAKPYTATALLTAVGNALS